MLLEPTSIVVKAWEHIDRIGSRTAYKPERVLVTGAGPVACWLPCLVSSAAWRCMCSIA